MEQKERSQYLTTQLHVAIWIFNENRVNFRFVSTVKWSFSMPFFLIYNVQEDMLICWRIMQTKTSMAIWCLQKWQQLTPLVSHSGTTCCRLLAPWKFICKKHRVSINHCLINVLIILFYLLIWFTHVKHIIFWSWSNKNKSVVILMVSIFLIIIRKHRC